MIPGKFWIYEQLASTNDQAKHLVINEEIPEGSVVLAYEQTKGRGQRDTTWHSDAGKSLTFSIVLFPGFPEADEQFLLNQAVTTGILEVMRAEITDTQWRIKWPNDIYAGRKKLGGILIENSLEGKKLGHSIVGIGLNINQEYFPDGLPNPVSLYQLDGRMRKLKSFAIQVTTSVYEKYRVLQSGDHQSVQADYLENLYLYQKWHTFKGIENQRFRGKITGLCKDGRLIITDPAGQDTRFSFKEVRF